MDNELSHPADGKAWKYFDSKQKTFAADPRNIRLGLATDDQSGYLFVYMGPHFGVLPRGPAIPGPARVKFTSVPGNSNTSMHVLEAIVIPHCGGSEITHLVKNKGGQERRSFHGL